MTKDLITVLSAKAATGVGNNILVEDFDTIAVQYGTASSANLTVKAQGSISDTAPDFSATQSVTNHWDYVDMIDLQDNASIDGDTGLAPAGTDDFRNLEMNVSGLKWINFRVTARSAGSVTIKVKLFNHNK